MLNSRRILYKFYIFLRFWINILHKRVFICFLSPHYFARTICTVDTIINIIITPSIIYIGQIGYPSTRLLTPTSISRAVTRTLIPPIIIMAILYNLSLFSSVTTTGKFQIAGILSINERNNNRNAARTGSNTRFLLLP